MNPTSDQQPQALPMQPPRSSFSCDRHPDENFTGFCPTCLCERLTTLDQAANASSSSRRNSTSSSTAAAAIKSIFRVSEGNKNKTAAATVTKNSFLPELRRTKSFSASKNDGLGISGCVYEPQRKSCDVRGRNTLWSLFSIHDENKPRLSYSQQQNSNGVVLETNREDEEDQVQKEDDDDDNGDQIRVTEELSVDDLANNIVEEPAEIEEKDEAKVDVLKPMKDQIDLDSQSKKPSRSNFWSAASVLSKKWHKWRRKQKKNDAGGNGVSLSSALPVVKPTSRQYRETQSEIADYGFGRRSCDTDPRFSLDAGRISFDDPRYSFDEPRASWDGYLIGRTFPRLPPMVEDVPIVHVPRCDTQIPVEHPPMPDDNLPGGSIQTREYYLDSSSKRRKSLDRSNSIRRMAASVIAELDETKVTPVKVSPAAVQPARDSTSNSFHDDYSETFELGFKDNEIPNEKKVKKETKQPKPKRWRWKLWGFIHRRHKDDEEEDRCSSVSGVGRSYSESWQDPRTGEGNYEANNGGIHKKDFRSWRSCSMRKSNFNMIGNEHGVLDRNRSARYSPNHVDNGLLRFYLAPLSGSRRGGIGIATGKSRPNSFARSMLGMY